MMSPLQKLLFDRKLDLLDKEKRASGPAQMAMTAQLQVIDIMLRFLASQQTEEDMEKLKLTLDAQPISLEEIKPRAENSALAEGLIEVSETLKAAWEKELIKAKKEKREAKGLAIPLNNLPADAVPKSVSTRIYGLRTAGKLPPNILPKIRTEDDGKGGKKEIIYMTWVKNPPVRNSSGQGA